MGSHQGEATFISARKNISPKNKTEDYCLFFLFFCCSSSCYGLEEGSGEGGEGGACF